MFQAFLSMCVSCHMLWQFHNVFRMCSVVFQSGREFPSVPSTFFVDRCFQILRPSNKTKLKPSQRCFVVLLFEWPHNTRKYFPMCIHEDSAILLPLCSRFKFKFRLRVWEVKVPGLRRPSQIHYRTRHVMMMIASCDKRAASQRCFSNIYIYICVCYFPYLFELASNNCRVTGLVPLDALWGSVSFSGVYASGIPMLYFKS